MEREIEKEKNMIDDKLKFEREYWNGKKLKMKKILNFNHRIW